MRKYSVGIGILGVVAGLSVTALVTTVPLRVRADEPLAQGPGAAFQDVGDDETPPVDVEAPAEDVIDDTTPVLPQADAPNDDPVTAVPEGYGVLLPGAPDAAPGAPAEDVRSISVVRGYLAAGDTSRALVAAQSFVDSHKRSRDRDAAWLLIGLLHREAGRHNSAADAFKRVRTSDGPLVPFGSWYEAEQEMLRGRFTQAVARCSEYRTRWPEATHAEACVEVLARANAALGKDVSAHDFAKQWDDAHPKAPIGEQVELALALWESKNAPARAIPRLQSLAIDHRAALTGRVAEELLSDLHEHGHADALIPDDLVSRQARAVSLREAGRKEESWALYTQLRKEAADNPALQRWVDDQAVHFAWRTRHFDFLAKFYEARYAANPNGGDAWEVQRALGRDGRWKEAADWCRIGLERHAQTREWRHRDDEIGHTFLLAGAWKDARDRLDVAAARGGGSGRRAALSAAFAARMGGDHADAVARYTKLVDQNREGKSEARYWRAKSYDALGKTAEAAADRAWIRDNDPQSWYGTLIASPEAPAEAPFGRDGTWPGAELPAFPAVPDAPAEVTSIPSAAWVSPRVSSSARGFASLTWDPTSVLAAAKPAPFVPIRLQRDLLAPPASYQSGPLFDASKAADALKALSTAHGADWPVLPAIEDLAHVGLYDLSGPLFAQLYEDVARFSRQSHNPKYAAARAVDLKMEEWRPLFLFTRDHNHTARYLYGLDRSIDDPALRLSALRLAWPLAHDRYVWGHAKDNGIDPYLVIGLMRQESTYNPIAVSPVGARGAMQIMPRTGHQLADLARDTTFSAGDLEDPVFAVGYGIHYLALLEDRFQSFPLAVAAYNSGPANVSSWLGGTGYDVPVDEFVEMIPFRETRQYVKSVSANYATYVALYAPQGTRIRVPDGVIHDDASIVDF